MGRRLPTLNGGWSAAAVKWGRNHCSKRKTCWISEMTLTHQGDNWLITVTEVTKEVNNAWAGPFGDLKNLIYQRGG